MKQFNPSTTLRAGNTPQHIAVIMDGNRRWAKAHGLSVLAGHKKVTDEVLEPLIEHAADRGVRYMTFWAWSTENWERDKREVTGIMTLFKNVISRRWKRLHEKGVCIKTIGDISKFETGIRESLEAVVEQTKNNTKITVILALNYGGRDELLRAIKKFCDYSSSELQASREVSAKNKESSRPGSNNNIPLTEKKFGAYLDTKNVPDPELIVRTGGEQRLSGFLLWQSEYSELYFADWYMPEFTPEKLDEVIADFNQRKRRFGR